MITNVIRAASFAFLTAFTLNVNAAPEKFTMDPSHTNIVWSANHFGFSNPVGKFVKSNGVIILDEKNPKASSVNVEIDTGSLITGLLAFDKHLKSADFLNVEKFPTAVFQSTKVEKSLGKKAKVYGNLTLLGITKPVVLDVKLNKIGEHPFTKKRTAGFSAKTTIKRSEFGINYALGGVSDEVQISIEAEASVE